MLNNWLNALGKSVSMGQRRSVQGTKTLGKAEIGLESVVVSANPQLAQINIASGVSAEPYIRFESSADRAKDPVPQTDSRLQLKIGDCL
jgi:hypothetical protein